MLNETVDAPPLVSGRNTVATLVKFTPLVALALTAACDVTAMLASVAAIAIL
jgi:hypothetical protein